MKIRPATQHDIDALYDICLRTGDGGSDASNLYTDHTLLGSVFVGPYLSIDGAFGFTIVDQQGPAGYVLAAIDTPSFELECERAWWPALRELYSDPGLHPRTADQALARYIHHPPTRSSDVVDSFPAHLHIDLLPRAQGHGIGVRLMDTILDGLREAEAAGVHLGVDPSNERAIGFYERLGFRTLSVDDHEQVMARPLRHEPSQ